MENQFRRIIERKLKLYRHKKKTFIRSGTEHMELSASNCAFISNINIWSLSVYLVSSPCVSMSDVWGETALCSSHLSDKSPLSHLTSRHGAFVTCRHLSSLRPSYPIVVPSNILTWAAAVNIGTIWWPAGSACKLVQPAGNPHVSRPDPPSLSRVVWLQSPGNWSARTGIHEIPLVRPIQRATANDILYGLLMFYPKLTLIVWLHQNFQNHHAFGVDSW